MAEIKVVSFDVEGTLVTLDFSSCVWYEAIPRVYARKKGLSVDEARQALKEEYDRVGDQRREWYDIHYWFQCFDLGDPGEVLATCAHKVALHPDAIETLASLKPGYRLVASSATPREFLEYLLHDIRPYFEQVFSSLSDLSGLKNTDFYLHVCRQLGASPEEVLHVGDNRQFDYVFPRQVGIQAFHLDRKAEAGQEQHTLGSLTELKSLLSRARLNTARAGTKAPGKASA